MLVRGGIAFSMSNAQYLHTCIVLMKTVVGFFRRSRITDLTFIFICNYDKSYMNVLDHFITDRVCLSCPKEPLYISFAVCGQTYPVYSRYSERYSTFYRILSDRPVMTLEVLSGDLSKERSHNAPERPYYLYPFCNEVYSHGQVREAEILYHDGMVNACRSLKKKNHEIIICQEPQNP